MTSRAAVTAWIDSSLKWLSQRRLRAQAIVLAVCLWGVCVADFATPGLFDRAGNIKFQDFLPFYISARMIVEHHVSELYDSNIQQEEVRAIVGQPTQARVPYLYGPQVGLLFVPLAKLSFPVAARIWAAFSLLIYFTCIYAVWRCCPNLRPHPQLIALAALAFPPLFHFFVRGQISALLLAFFTAAFLALRADRFWLAGIALGLLVFKPQFLVAIPLIFLLAGAWRLLAGLIVSAGAQLVFARMYFGPAVMRSYIDMLLHSSRWIGTAELALAPVQMHSLRSFWSLLIPSPTLALALYFLCALAVLWMAAAIWKSSALLALKFSALIFAAVLVNPHLFVYDLLVLAPAILLFLDETLARPTGSAALRLLLYLAFLLPLFGPLSRWTHIQLSVPVFAAVLWTVYRPGTAGHKLAPDESGVV